MVNIAIEVKAYILLTDVTVDSCQRVLPRCYVVIGVDGGSSGVTFLLQIVVQTLVHIIVVPDITTLTNYCYNDKECITAEK